MAYTDIDKPELHFQTKTYTANGSANRLITLDGSEDMQPDWVWLKNRNQAVTHDLYDSVRGATKYISSDQTTAEATNPDGLIAFNTNGFTVDTSWGNISSGDGYVAWCWKAANGTASNTDGSITSTVSANTTSGFSIVSYTGSGSAATIGHGLSTSPSMILVKNRSTAYSWIVYHKSLGATKNLYLDLANAADTASIQFNDTEPTSSVFSVGTSLATNKSGDNLIAYCFAEKKGFSKFGSYTGNGSTNGTFVYTGFKPAFVITKRTDGTVDWYMFDNKRQNSFNVVNGMLRPSATSTELDESSVYVDFLSNGFKWRGNNAGNNTSGGSYIYMAFAENPFVTSTGIPACAR